MAGQKESQRTTLPRPPPFLFSWTNPRKQYEAVTFAFSFRLYFSLVQTNARQNDARSQFCKMSEALEDIVEWLLGEIVYSGFDGEFVLNPDVLHICCFLQVYHLCLDELSGA